MTAAASTSFVLHTGAPGTYWASDAEFASIKHKLASFEVCIVPFAELEQWVADAPEPGEFLVC